MKSKKGLQKPANPLICMVGMTRFELATPCSRSRCATRLRYIPKSIFSSLFEEFCQGERRRLPQPVWPAADPDDPFPHERPAFSVPPKNPTHTAENHAAAKQALCEQTGPEEDRTDRRAHLFGWHLPLHVTVAQSSSTTTTRKGGGSPPVGDISKPPQLAVTERTIY